MPMLGPAASGTSSSVKSAGSLIKSFFEAKRKTLTRGDCNHAIATHNRTTLVNKKEASAQMNMIVSALNAKAGWQKASKE